jgi:endonuclease/exonuclease/phosphatase family metal-dependent hydrolase
MLRALAVLLAILVLASPGRAHELKLATWNIAWLTLRQPGDPGLPRAMTFRAPADYAALARYARQLDADVIALQEVDGPEAAARVFDPSTYAFFFAREDDVQRTGFAIRKTLRATQNEDLDRLDLRAGSRRSLRRGTDVTVGSGQARIRLLSIHLNAGCNSGPIDRPDPECETLNRQTEILSGWISARQRDRMAFAVLGDFNRRLTGPNPHEDMMRALAGPEIPLIRATEGRSNPCWSDARGGRPFIDHILLGGGAERWWLRDSLRVLVYAERDGAKRDLLSDHCPVSIRLALPG